MLGQRQLEEEQIPPMKGRDMKWTRTRAAGALAAGTAALALSACTGNPEPSISYTPPEPVTITIGFWGESGIVEDATGPSLESLYEEAHPWVSLEMVVGEYGATHDALTQALIAGSGAANVAAIDEGYITGFVAEAENFVNLLDLGAGQYEDAYLPWKWQEAANADGSVVIGLGNDVGGLALCYRKDLFEAAGLPSDRDAVSAAVGDSWEDFTDFGQEYVAATGKRFIDSATTIFNTAIIQLGGDTGYAYFDRHDELDIDNVLSAYNVWAHVVDAGLSNSIVTLSPEWEAGLTSDEFAVILCSSSMLAEIKNRVPADFDGNWDIADIPGPGGNSGGSFYTIPRQGTEYEQIEAYRFVEWLTQPEQQLKIMAETGNLPSQTAILQSDAVANLTDPFFNDAPYGQIFAKTVVDIPGPIYHSRCEGAVRVAIEDALIDGLLGQGIPETDWAVVAAAEQAADQCSSN
jgi:cellobiose transport system substrate-binding protein